MISFRRPRGPERITGVPEAEIAVGSLSGVAPSRIQRHVVVVLDNAGRMHVSTSACKHEVPELLVRALQIAVEDAAAPGSCFHGAPSAAGHWEGMP